MPTPHRGLSWGVCLVALFAAACAAKKPAPAPEPQPAPAVVEIAAPAPIPASDPVADLIARSDEHFEHGRKELEAGHLETAKTAFNQSLEVLLEWPGGARSEPRIREQYDRLVERISAYEVTALAQGDGFAEKASEPASIDELLAIATFEAPAASKETEQAVAQDLKEVVHDIEIPLNPRVLSYVQLFSGRLKGYLEEGLSRGARFLPMIQDVFRAEGLPLDLAYVPLIESAFKPNALSRAKAKGIWQFMRGTALENGLKHDWYIDERSDPEKATRAAAKYLKTLYGMFDDWHLALASYNGGPGRVQRAIKRSGRDDFWKLTSTKQRYLPRETRDYVPLILAAVIIARNPSQYGMNVVPMDTPGYETVTLASAVDLRRVAEWAGTPVQTIQDLNPELRRWTTPLRATDYELKVPEGTADVINARMLEVSADELAPLNRHTVKKGETLLSIAKKLKVSRADLAEANYLSTKASLKAGQQLIIPRAPTLLLAANTETTPPAVETPAVASGPSAVDAVPASAPVRRAAPRVESAPEKVVHRVRRGDTLYSIAKRYDTTVEELKEWNRLRSSAIQVGQRLTIFRDSGPATN